MSASSLAGCPAITATTSTDLSVISLTSASSLEKKLAFASAIASLNINR